MSATDELREGLKKRGESWHKWPDEDSTTWQAYSDPHTATESMDGTLIVTGLTPEQAIAATLGTETCKVEYVSEWMGWHCKSCDTLWQGLRDQRPSFCMRCGAKVVDE